VAGLDVYRTNEYIYIYISNHIYFSANRSYKILWGISSTNKTGAICARPNSQKCLASLLPFPVARFRLSSCDQRSGVGTTSTSPIGEHQLSDRDRWEGGAFRGILVYILLCPWQSRVQDAQAI